jgi:hypothetical protein
MNRNDITLNEMFKKGNDSQGNTEWFGYDAFTKNCQAFISTCLSVVGLNNSDISAFVYQPVEELLMNLPAYVPKITKFITDPGGFVNKITGQGGVKNEEGLSNIDIDKMMNNKKIKGVYLGTVARDQIDDLIDDKVKPESGGAFIYNTDPASKHGEHWRCIFYDARPGGSKSIEMFDSYGDDPTRKDMKDMKRLSDKLCSDVLLKLKINKMKLQSEGSDTCGYMCVRFIMHRMRGKTFSEATGFDRKIKNMSMVKESEQDISKFKKQIGGSFNYI